MAKKMASFKKYFTGHNSPYKAQAWIDGDGLGFRGGLYQRGDGMIMASVDEPGAEWVEISRGEIYRWIDMQKRGNAAMHSA
jgi:hypothetical protein